MRNNIYVIILAAGSGTRFGDDKMLNQINGKPVFSISAETFLKSKGISKIVFVCSKQNKQIVLDHFSNNSKVDVILGADTRHNSFCNGFNYINQNFKLNDQDIIVVHDAARAFVDVETIEGVIKKCEKTGFSTCYKQLTDSIYNSKELKYENRDHMCLIQTPQAFKTTYSDHIFTKRNENDTDLFCGSAITLKDENLFLSKSPNKKITYKTDLFTKY